MAFSQPPVHLSAEGKIFPAEPAWLGTRGQGKRPAGAKRVPEFPGFSCEILFGDDVLRYVPPFEVAGENQFEFDLSLLLAAIVACDKVIASIVANDLKQRFVGAVDVFEFEIEDRINPVFP